MRKVKFFVFVIVFMLILQVTAFAAVSIDLTQDTTYQTEGTTLLSVGKPVSFSSSYTAGSGAWKYTGINDGKVGMGNPVGWTTDPNAADATETKEAWVEIDLEDIYGISRIILWPRQDAATVIGYPVDFTLQVSINGTDWTTVVTKTNQTGVDHEAKIFDITKINARFVRMHCTKRSLAGTQWVAQLAEMAVYGGAPITETPPETSDSSTFIMLAFVLMAAATYLQVLRKQKAY